MFHIGAKNLSRCKFSKLSNPKTPFKIQNTFSGFHKYNQITIKSTLPNQRFFSSEKKPEDYENDEGDHGKRKTNKQIVIEEVESAESVYRDRVEKLYKAKAENATSTAEVILERFEEQKNQFREAAFDHEQGIHRERRAKAHPSEINVLEEKISQRMKRKRERERAKRSAPKNETGAPKEEKEHLLIGEYLMADPFKSRRREDGKIYDDMGNEIPVNPKTGYPIPPHFSERDEAGFDTEELSTTAKRRMLTLDDERHERNLKELRLRALQVSTAMGMQGARYRADSLPVEELRKVWQYVRNPHPQKPISTVVFNYNAGDFDGELYTTGDPLIKYFRRMNFFRPHPEQKYLYLAGLFAIGIAVALAIAIFDALTLDHTGQEDKNKNYFRARLLSALGYTSAGAGATLLFTRLFANLFLNAKRIDLYIASLSALPIYLIFANAHRVNFPSDSSIGKLTIATGLSAAAGLGIATHSLKKGTGFARLLVPILLSTTALSTSLAISPFDFNLEYGAPLAVVSATLAGMFGASAIFPPYRNKTRAVFGTLFALTYAGLLLSHVQPYLNNIKFQENYYGADAVGQNTNLVLKSLFFFPLKAIDIVADQNSKRDLFK